MSQQSLYSLLLKNWCECSVTWFQSFLRLFDFLFDEINVDQTTKSHKVTMNVQDLFKILAMVSDFVAQSLHVIQTRNQHGKSWWNIKKSCFSVIVSKISIKNGPFDNKKIEILGLVPIGCTGIENCLNSYLIW